MSEQNFPSHDEQMKAAASGEDHINEKDSETRNQAYQPASEQSVNGRTQVQPVTGTQAPHRYQTVGTQVYRQAPGRENSRVYYQQPVIQSQTASQQDDKRPGSMPGVIGFGFASSLMSLFLIPFFRELFPIFLKSYADPINYDRQTYLMYFVMILIYGGISAMLAVFGLIFAPVGMNKAKRNNLEGRALGTATILISAVSLILLLASTVSLLLIHNML